MADYLIYLDQNDKEYEKYLQWKVTGPSQQFKQLIDIQKYDMRCRACTLVAQNLGIIEKPTEIDEKIS